MLTVEKIKKILTKNFLKSLNKNTAITIFFSFDEYEIGVSYETGNPTLSQEKEIYVFYIFTGYESIKIDYVYGNQGLNDDVFQKLVDTWNEIVNIKKILVERIQTNSSMTEIEEILGEQISGDIVEALEDHIETALYEINDHSLGKLILQHLSPSEIGNVFKMIL